MAAAGRPCFIEAKCYRFGGHYAADPARYRPAGEDEEWRRLHCPIRKLGDRLSMPDAELQAGIARAREDARRLIEELA
jgi:TPP-dependent pyruvate/acetoin dehydrogenase alpha subunit